MDDRFTLPASQRKRSSPTAPYPIPLHNWSKQDEKLKRLRHLTPDDTQFRCLADIGCADATLTAYIAWKLNIDKVYAADIYPETKFRQPNLNVDLFGEKNSISPIDYVQENHGLLNIPSNSVDLVICLMSIHHFQDRVVTLQEITRIMKPGGYLFIREHDVDPNNDKLRKKIDDIHIQFTSGERKEYITYDITGHYMTMDYLRDQLERLNMEFIGYNKYPPPNPQEVYHAMYQLRQE